MPSSRSFHVPEPAWARTTKNARRVVRRSNKAIMRSYHFQIPWYDMPIRLRPWFVLFTCIIMLSLAFFGFTNFSHGLPVNDKLLHFFGLMLATAMFYFIIDVEEEARRVWFWRRSPLIISAVVCCFFGGIVSEYVQSMLPYKEFQMGDIVANLLGSSIGLYVAYHLEKYYRHRREISRLYRPLDTESLPSDDEGDDFEAGTALLPTHVDNTTRTSPTKTTAKSSRIGDVWDVREELFNIGDSDDEEGQLVSSGAQPEAGPPPPTPKIVVTSSD